MTILENTICEVEEPMSTPTLKSSISFSSLSVRPVLEKTDVSCDSLNSSDMMRGDATNFCIKFTYAISRMVRDTPKL